ncbi:MAG: hypothetical protein LBI14_02415 [Treponema sp.]|nr:hypothetical protein [Treponema sp.]
MKKLFLIILICIPLIAQATPLYSPTWGFSLDLPDDYMYTDGDGRDRFSFVSPDGAVLDLVVYYAQSGRAAPYSSVEAMAADVQRRIGSTGDVSVFDYHHKRAAIFDLTFINPADGRTYMNGWGLALELEGAQNGNAPLLLALSYGPAARQGLMMLHLSVLDSIAPREADRLYPGPITEFAYPRETRISYPIWDIGEEAWFYAEDEEASQALIEREFEVLLRYANSPYLEDAWIRYYRTIYKDSYERLANAAFIIERKLNAPNSDSRAYAGLVLDWIQCFEYERNFDGSDFVNLVSAVIDGRGDCDTRAMLWALILNYSNIQAAMMISPEYGHAMGLADLGGTGARFELEGRLLLVAETTARIPLGLIAEDMSNSDYWFGVRF